ncbi:MAG: hypothetical protein LUF92_16290 [Clostridiales bacterium]|nr:hypothetical protein [Clostridiales bacterium]
MSLAELQPGEVEGTKKQSTQSESRKAQSVIPVCIKENQEEKILKDYSFETLWKDEITAHVEVKGGQVEVTRYTTHPVKQLFASEHMTRYQLNQIFEMRCWDKNRPDIMDILRHLGLKDYNPYEIIKKTHGVSFNDFVWFRFPGEELRCEDVMARSDYVL